MIIMLEEKLFDIEMLENHTATQADTKNQNTSALGNGRFLCV